MYEWWCHGLRLSVLNKETTYFYLLIYLLTDRGDACCWYRDEYADVVVVGATQAHSSDCSDDDADTEDDVAGREDEVELVVNVDELVERGVSTQPDSDTDHPDANQLKIVTALPYGCESELKF